jgi:hypothetical protein
MENIFMVIPIVIGMGQQRGISQGFYQTGFLSNQVLIKPGFAPQNQAGQKA